MLSLLIRPVKSRQIHLPDNSCCCIGLIQLASDCLCVWTGGYTDGLSFLIPALFALPRGRLLRHYQSGEKRA